MPDKNPPAGKPGDFLCGKPHVDRHTCKSKHPGQGRWRTDFRSRFLYFRIAPGSPASFLRRTHKGKHACKNEHPERRRRRTDFRSRFLYFYIVPSFFSWGFFAKNTCWQAARKRQTPRRRSDSRIVLRSRRPGGLLRAVRVRQPDLDSGGHFRRDGLSPGSSPSGRGGGILPGQL